jgi:raffinose/stachyose/melibiose transport system substrate-binding protein
MMRSTSRFARKAATVAAGSALMAGVLAGCGSPTAPSSGSGSGASALPSNSADANLKGVTLTVWESNSLTAGYKALFTAFEKATGAKVDQVVFPDPFESNLLTKWATGARPDLMIFQSAPNEVQQLNPSKNLFDLTSQSYVAKELFGQNKSASVVGGRDYGLSLETPTVFGLWFNKQILSEDGLTAPTDFAQLVSTCQTIKHDNPGVSPLYDAGGDQWPTQVLPLMLWADPMTASLVDDLNTNKAQWTNPALVQALTDYKTLIGDGCFNSNLSTGTYAQQETEFETGKTAMITQGSWVSPDLETAMGVTKMNREIGWQALSTTNATAAFSTTFSLQVPKTGDTTQESAALSFLDYAAGPAYQVFLNANEQAPALSGFSTPPGVPTALVANYTALVNAVVPPNLAASYGPLTTYMSELIDGSATPEKVASDLQQQWTQSATALNLPGF